MVMGDKTENDSKELLSEVLKDYQGHFEIDSRKNSTVAFTAGAQSKLSPISTYATQIATRFGKVGRVDYLKIFAEMKNYVNEFSEKFHLNNFDKEFFSTRLLSISECDKISDIELEILSNLDEILINIQKENNHEFLQEIESSIPLLKRSFEAVTVLFEERATLIDQYSERHNKITSVLNDIDGRLKNMDNSSSISEITKSIEKEYINLPSISVSLMEIYSTHLTSFNGLSGDSDKYQIAVEYYNGFIAIINDAKVHYSRGALLSSDRDKVKDLIKSSGNLSDKLKALKDKKTEAEMMEEADRKRSKMIRTILIFGAILLAAAGAAFYFFK